MSNNNVELIIYLEPSRAFTHNVESFLNKIEEKYGPTTANKYGCHISMTGFFSVEAEKVEEMRNILDDVITSSGNFRSKFDVPQINLMSLVAIDSVTQLPKHLILPVITPDVYVTTMKKVSQVFEHIVRLRLKKINHISLAYWDEPQATPEQQREWEEKVSNGIFDKIKEDADVYFKNAEAPSSWDVVLYKRVYKGDFVGQRHVFQELCRWSSTIGM